MLSKLIELANTLDLMGLEKEANDVDAVIRRLSKVVKFASNCENHDDDAITFFEEDMDADEDLNEEYPELDGEHSDDKEAS